MPSVTGVKATEVSVPASTENGTRVPTRSTIPSPPDLWMARMPSHIVKFTVRNGVMY